MKIFTFALFTLALSRHVANTEASKKNVFMDSFLLQMVNDYEKSGHPLNLRQNNTENGMVIPKGILMTSDGNFIVEIKSDEDDTEKLVRTLEALGATVTGCYSLVKGRCSAVVNVADLAAVAAEPSVKWVGTNMVQTQVGSVESQASESMFADVAREVFNVDGSGVKVCVLSDSFDVAVPSVESGEIKTSATDDVALGDLPPFDRMDIVRDYDLPFSPGFLSDEGRGMMQLIHDVAPGADLGFYSAFLGLAAFAQGILVLVNSGCDVIVDDVIYPSEAMFQDDLVAQAVDYAKAQNKSYFSSAGNTARGSLEVVYRESISGIKGLNQTILFDDGSGGTISFLTVFLDGRLIMQYDQPTEYKIGLPGPTTDLDIYIFNSGTQTVVARSESNNLRSGDPFEIVSVPPGIYDIVIRRDSGPAPGLIKLVSFGSFEKAINFDPKLISSGASFGHANAVGAIAVGAARYTDTPGFDVSPAIQEPFSSAGGVPIFFDLDGKRLAKADVRAVPAFTSVDGTCTNFFGEQDALDTGDPNCFNFFGTSAAAPNAAAVAALMLQVNPTLTPDEIRFIMEQSSEEMDDSFTPFFDHGFDYGTGEGFLNALRAVTAANMTSNN